MDVGRRIYCVACKCYMGKLRDATVRVGMVVLCERCEAARQDLLRASATRGSRPHDLFDHLFKKL